MEYNKERKEITINRKLNKLDMLVIKFVDILKKHADYTIISGYISIVLGRSRATEDVDVLIERIGDDKFYGLYKELIKEGFWCINAEDAKEVFSYLQEGYAVRFALKDTSIPNFEVKFPKTLGEKESFHDTLILELPEGEIKICSLESHVAFKRYFLKGEKDIEDAEHVEEIFRELDEQKINKYRMIIESDE